MLVKRYLSFSTSSSISIITLLSLTSLACIQDRSGTAKKEPGVALEGRETSIEQPFSANQQVEPRAHAAEKSDYTQKNDTQKTTPGSGSEGYASFPGSATEADSAGAKKGHASSKQNQDNMRPCTDEDIKTALKDSLAELKASDDKAKQERKPFCDEEVYPKLSCAMSKEELCELAKRSFDGEPKLSCTNRYDFWCP